MRSNPQTAQFTYLKYTMQGVLIYSCQWATITKTNFYNDYHYRYYVTSGHFHPPPPPPVPYPLAVTPLPSGPLSPSEAEETTNLFSVPIVLPSLDISPKQKHPTSDNVWLLSFSTLFTKFIHAVACISTSSFFLAKACSTV